MNTFIWILQFLMAVLFLYSGSCKSILSQHKLVAYGQTAVEDISLGLTRFIGAIEIVGAFGLILPLSLNILPKLTALSAIGFSIVMVLGARMHYRRHEPKAVVNNPRHITALCADRVVQALT